MLNFIKKKVVHSVLGDLFLYTIYLYINMKELNSITVDK